MSSVSDLRLILVVEDFPPHAVGGAGRSNAILAQAMLDHVRNVYVVHRSATEIHHYEMTRGGPRDCESAAVCSQGGRLLVHVSGRVDHEYVASLKDRLRSKVLFTSRSNAYALDRLGTRPVVDARNRRQDALIEIASVVVACSRAEADGLKADYPAAASKISPVHNALDPVLLKHLSACPDARDGVPVSVAFFGRLRVHKGFLVLLSAVERLWSSGSDFRLDVFGGHAHLCEGDLRASIERARSRWGDLIALRDWTDDPGEVARAYRSAHCVVVPSYYEPFGLVALEALAAGCCVVASDTGGLPEVLKGAMDASLFPVGDADALSASIRSCVQRISDRSTRSGEADRVARRFSPDKMAWSYLDLYAKLL